MLQKIGNIDIFSENTYTILGIVFGEVSRYDILVIKKKKDRLSISKSRTLTDFSDVKNTINKKNTLLLNFSGKGVINKRVESKANYIKEVLFNGSSEDFYVYTLFEDQNNFVSISRKEVINEQFELLERAGFKPVDFSLGPFVSALSQQFLNQDIVLLESSTLVFKNKRLIDFSNRNASNETYKIGNETLKSKDIVLFSSLLNFLYPSDKIQYNNAFLCENSKEQNLRKMFDYFAFGSLVFFLVALFSSYILLNYFNNEYVKYEQQLYHFNDDYFQIKKMEEDLRNKQFIARNSGVLSENFLSFYINEIGVSIPNEIVLSNLKINPIAKKVKTNEKIEIEPNTILLEGNAKRNVSVNKWVKELRKYDWIDKIEILNLNTNSGNKDSFSIKIFIR